MPRTDVTPKPPGVARLHVVHDPDDPGTVEVSEDPVPGSVPIIPTSLAHLYWTLRPWTGPKERSGTRRDEIAASRLRHPSRR